MSPSAQIVWSPLAHALAAEIAASAKRPLCVAIAGAQGSGKTTLARGLTDELARAGIRAVACSLDDFYLGRAQRVALSHAVHPLLITRGVPGTHDVELCLRVLDGVTQRPTPMPVFDKGLDERIEPDRWPIAGPVDVVVIEGWCLGARAQPPERLTAPVNELERDEDPDGVFRRFVNDALGARYQDLFRRFDKLVYLQVPDFDAVRRWRAEQELQIPEQRRMDTAQLRRFTAHYERLTRWMIEDVPGRADLTVVLDRAHRIATWITKSAP
jgi:D-glycerate 3-kinase